MSSSALVRAQKGFGNRFLGRQKKGSQVGQSEVKLTPGPASEVKDSTVAISINEVVQAALAGEDEATMLEASYEATARASNQKFPVKVPESDEDQLIENGGAATSKVSMWLIALLVTSLWIYMLVTVVVPKINWPH
jgi:hypothetical protein